MWDSRELPDGARQSETNGELASEQPTESEAQIFSERYMDMCGNDK